VLATGLAVRQVIQERKRERRDVSVRCLAGLLRESPEHPITEAVWVRVVNEGHRQVEVRSVHFRRQDGEDVYGIAELGDKNLPAMLSDGQAVVVRYGKQPFDKQAKEGHEVGWAVVLDASGKEYLGEYENELG
jgi:predicted RNA-binding protein with EMAP domain